MISSITLVPYLVTKIWGVPFDMPHIIVVLVCSTLLSCVASFFSHDNDITEIFPPISILTYLYFVLHALCGNVKVIRTVDYKFFCRYTDGKINIYDFGVLTYSRIIRMEFDNTSHTSNRIRTNLYKYLEVPLDHHKKEKYFKGWDGSLDEQSKRISTIKNIIE